MQTIRMLLAAVVSTACAQVIGADFGDYQVAAPGPSAGGVGVGSGGGGSGGSTTATGGSSAGGVANSSGGSVAGAGGNATTGGAANGGTAGGGSGGGSPIYEDDFEDGDAADWTITPGTYATPDTAVEGTGANGTPLAFRMSITDPSQHADSATALHSLPSPTQIHYVSVWGMTSDADGTHAVRLRSGTSQVAIVLGFDRGRSYCACSSSVAAAPGTWHHLEARNIDWNAIRYDFYFDEQFVTSARFPSGATSVDAIELSAGVAYSVTSATTVFWDEIVVQ